MVITRKEISEEMALYNKGMVPNITPGDCDKIIGLVINHFNKVNEDDQDLTVSFYLQKLGRLMLDMGLSSYKMKDNSINKNPDYYSTVAKVEELRRIRKKYKYKYFKQNFKNSILFSYTYRFIKKVPIHVHKNFYKYWINLAENHRKEHESI